MPDSHIFNFYGSTSHNIENLRGNARAFQGQVNESLRMTNSTTLRARRNAGGDRDGEQHAEGILPRSYCVSMYAYIFSFLQRHKCHINAQQNSNRDLNNWSIKPLPFKRIATSLSRLITVTTTNTTLMKVMCTECGILQTRKYIFVRSWFSSKQGPV